MINNKKGYLPEIKCLLLTSALFVMAVVLSFSFLPWPWSFLVVMAVIFFTTFVMKRIGRYFHGEAHLNRPTVIRKRKRVSR